jgi:hypothetical protein
MCEVNVLPDAMRQRFDGVLIGQLATSAVSQLWKFKVGNQMLNV